VIDDVSLQANADLEAVLACLGLARTTYTQCTYGTFGLEITIYTGIYVYVRFWPTLCMLHSHASQLLQTKEAECIHKLASHCKLRKQMEGSRHVDTAQTDR